MTWISQTLDEPMKEHDKLCRVLNYFQCIGKATRGWRDVPRDQIAICVIKLEEKVDLVQFRQADDRLVHDLFLELTNESGVNANTLSDK
jgi:hypothetical protein